MGDDGLCGTSSEGIRTTQFISQLTRIQNSAGLGYCPHLREYHAFRIAPPNF